MRRNIHPTKFYLISALLSNFHRRFLYLFSRVFDPPFRFSECTDTWNLRSISAVSIMQIRPAPAAKEETIYISRKYACHRDVNRALAQRRRCWKGGIERRSRTKAYIEKIAKAAPEGSSPISMSARRDRFKQFNRNCGSNGSRVGLRRNYRAGYFHWRFSIVFFIERNVHMYFILFYFLFS